MEAKGLYDYQATAKELGLSHANLRKIISRGQLKPDADCKFYGETIAAILNFAGGKQVTATILEKFKVSLGDNNLFKERKPMTKDFESTDAGDDHAQQSDETDKGNKKSPMDDIKFVDAAEKVTYNYQHKINSNTGVAQPALITPIDIVSSDTPPVKEENFMEKILAVSTDTAIQTAALPQLEVEIKFYLQQTAQNIIEVGKRLIQAKELVPHGEWLNWLKNNFNLKERMARNFMEIFRRFSNRQSIADFDISTFNTTQMITMLALPEGDEEKFIDQKAAEGKPVEDMTVKTLREEVKKWKDKAGALEMKAAMQKGVLDRWEKKHQDEIVSLEVDLEYAQKDIAKLQGQLSDAQKENEELSNKPPETVVPSDYHELQQRDKDQQTEIENLKIQIAEMNRRKDAKDLLQEILSVHSKVNRELHDSPSQLVHKVLRDYLANATEIILDAVKLLDTGIYKPVDLKQGKLFDVKGNLIDFTAQVTGNENDSEGGIEE